MLLMIDNYDSFTYNLVQYLGELGQRVRVVRNDELSVGDIEELAPERIVLSPGPCTPNEAGVSLELVRRMAGRVPLLGVCLGHQAIGQAFGGRVVHAKTLMHGKVSSIHHTGAGVFRGLPSPYNATRYHSLAIERESCPAELEVTAWTDDGEIMGVRHRSLPIEGCNSTPSRS
jgi:anthranilate synthase component 2